MAVQMMQQLVFALMLSNHSAVPSPYEVAHLLQEAQMLIQPQNSGDHIAPSTPEFLLLTRH